MSQDNQSAFSQKMMYGVSTLWNAILMKVAKQIMR